MPLTVRIASNADQEAVIHVIKTVYDEFGFPWYPEGYHVDLYDLDAHYRDHGDTFYLAELDGQPVGTAALELFPKIERELRRVPGVDCSVERLYVLPSIRRAGVATALMNRVIEDARAAGRTRMEIWTDKNFTAAHALYQRLGAEVVAERLCDDPEESPEWGMALNL
ncbi:GNAT family N-acetyltransferase [bacterium]|nr:MAG: GNAT family N-acetyltransferase [bacterium]